MPGKCDGIDLNPEITERNTKAAENGYFCEEYAKRMIPGNLEWIDGTCDALWNGKKVDVKGCEAWYPRKDKPNATRRKGMFTLDFEQHAELEKEHGFYYCVVHIGELVVKSFFIPACKIDFQNHAQKRIAWTTMQKLAEAC